jgi:hypothetical protein
MADVSSGALNVVVLSGEVRLGRNDVVPAGQLLSFVDGKVARAKADAAAVRQALVRSNELRPEHMAVFRAGFDKSELFAFELPAGDATDETVTAADGRGPEVWPALQGAHAWISLKLGDAVPYSGGTVVQARYKTNASRLCMVVEGHLKEVPAKGHGAWVEDVWDLAGALKEGVPIVPGEEIRSLHLAVRSGQTLEIDALQVRRRVD